MQAYIFDIPDNFASAQPRGECQLCHFAVLLAYNMSRFGRYPLNIPSLTEAFANFQQNVSGSNQRRDRQDYDDRRFRDRDRDTRRDDEYGRRDSGGARGRSSRERFSPEVSFT